MKRAMVSAKNTLRNSEYANTEQAYIFDQVIEQIKFQMVEAFIGFEESNYKCIYRPVKNDRVYSAKSIYLWVTNMIMNGKTTTLGMSLKDGSRIEFDVKVKYTGFRLGVEIDPSSITYSKLNMKQKLQAGSLVAGMVVASVIAL